MAPRPKRAEPRAGHNGTIVGSLTFAAGKFGNAASGFTDANYVSLPSGTFSYGVNAFTIEMWLKTTATAFQIIVTADPIALDPAQWVGMLDTGHFAASVPGSDELSADGSSGNGATLDSGIAINDGNWHNCVLVYGGGILKVYVDGVAGSTSLSGVPTALVNTGGLIGQWIGESLTWTNGQVDELSIWNFQKYTANFTPPSLPYTGNEAGLLALYHLESDARDSTGTNPFIPGNAPLPQTENFDSDPVGSIAQGWYNISGSWQVGTVNPVSSPNSFGDTANTDGDVALYSHMAAVADMDVYAEQVLTNDEALIGKIVRSDDTGRNAYLVNSSSNGGLLTLGSYSYVNGAAALLSWLTTNVAATVGQIYAMRVRIVGTTLSAKVWPKSAGEPQAWLYTVDDSSVTAPGYAGLYNTATNSKSIDNFTVSAPPVQTSIAPNSPTILYSPGNWDVTAARALSINSGAYFSTMFSGPPIALNFDVSTLGNPPTEIYYRIDGFEAQSPFTMAPLASVVTPAMPPATAALSYHLLEVVFKSSSELLNRWDVPSATAVKFTGLSIAAGGSTLAPLPAPGNILIFGDSITEGVRTVNMTAPNDTDRNDVMMEWSYQQRHLLGVEVGVIGFGATGLVNTGTGNVPPLPQTYNYIMQGIARVPPNVKMIVMNEGTNDGAANPSAVTAALTTVLNGLLMAYPGVPIVVMQPFNGSQTAALEAGIASCSNPGRVHWMDTSGFFNPAYGSTDGLHPAGPNALAVIAPKVAAALLPTLYPKGRSYSFY